MKDNAEKLADEYWSLEYFGIPLDVFEKTGTHIIPHAGELLGYEGVFVLQRNDSCIVSCPERLIGRVQGDLMNVQPNQLFDATFLQTMLPGVWKIIGPAWIGYFLEGTDLPQDNSSTFHRGTGLEMGNALKVLQQECDPVEWEYSSLGEDSVFIIGLEKNGKIAAAAGYKHWGKNIAHIGVITHPAFRGQGLGKLVVAETVRRVLQEEMLPQYRTLMANTAAIKISESLGFKKYGESIAARLSPTASQD